MTRYKFSRKEISELLNGWFINNDSSLAFTCLINMLNEKADKPKEDEEPVVIINGKRCKHESIGETDSGSLYCDDCGVWLDKPTPLKTKPETKPKENWFERWIYYEARTTLGLEPKEAKEVTGRVIDAVKRRGK